MDETVLEKAAEESWLKELKTNPDANLALARLRRFSAPTKT